MNFWMFVDKHFDGLFVGAGVLVWMIFVYFLDRNG